uniref:Uncharacterized protein n=1 Tax=Rhizophagus irregularis (strain DAOM 181602 / DAOM 197198 / MUCL 43194) TaxID=747089 RepID=U9TXI1_RHIID
MPYCIFTVVLNLYSRNCQIYQIVDDLCKSGTGKLDYQTDCIGCWTISMIGLFEIEVRKD